MPSPEFASSTADARAVVARVPGCVPVGPRWLHATVTRTPYFRDTTEVELDDVSRALDQLAAHTLQFTVPLSAPTERRASVALAGQNSQAWLALVEQSRALVLEVFGRERDLPPAPSEPHISIGYGTSDTNSDALTNGLSMLASRAYELRVDAVHFVSVHQDRVHGTITWDTISEHPFHDGAATRTQN